MNRLQKFQFKADSKMKRGDFEEIVSEQVSSYDINMLRRLPTTVSRWDKKQKKYYLLISLKICYCEKICLLFLLFCYINSS